MTIIALAGVTLAGCAASGSKLAANSDYRTTIATALNYRAANSDPRRYSISDPWTALDGTFMTCVRDQIPDGRGGYTDTNHYRIYVFSEGKITAEMVTPTETDVLCPIRTYEPLPKIP